VRRHIVQDWLDQAREQGAAASLLPCAFRERGIWAGIADLLRPVVEALREYAPYILDRHSYELCLVLPQLRRTLTVLNPNLTDTASDEEKTRNYAPDRAYRSLHGLIDLIATWHEQDSRPPWAIALDSLDEAMPLVHHFFAELMRRRGHQLGLRLLVTVAPGQGKVTRDRFHASTQVAHMYAEVPTDPVIMHDPAEMTRRAEQLEQVVSADPLVKEEMLPQLIDAWERSATPQRALPWQVEAMALYNNRGLYAASAAYAPTLEAGLDYLYEQDHALHENALTVLYFCLVMLEHVEHARALLEHELRAREIEPRLRPRLYYLMAMLHSRFLPVANQELAERYLNDALELLPTLDLPESKLAFLIVYMMNGLALVRLRQRRPDEAVALGRDGLAMLEARLSPERHRLHRSVLVYNAALVYTQLGALDDALSQFTAVIELDPNYSEYYNERGNIYLLLGQLEDAERDYLRAIELSPPYPEVWANLGLCYRKLGRMEDMRAAYSRAIDLDPNQPLALAGRAEAHAALGDTSAALADYDATLALSPELADVLAARAALRYDVGRRQAALEDLNRALELAPDQADYYYNRATVLEEMGHVDAAARDLRAYLRLTPEADDRDEVVDKLALFNVPA
jgi:tetratricopeptide (TPR) repeat protein